MSYTTAYPPRARRSHPRLGIALIWASGLVAGLVVVFLVVAGQHHGSTSGQYQSGYAFGNTSSQGELLSQDELSSNGGTWGQIARRACTAEAPSGSSAQWDAGCAAGMLQAAGITNPNV